MPCVRSGDRIRLHLLLTIVGPLLSKTAIRKQIKATTRVASLDLSSRMRAIMLVPQEAMTDIPTTHGTSSTPNVTNDLQMKLIDFRPLART